MKTNPSCSASAVKTVVLMMAATVVSKVLGLLRTTMLAAHYGTTAEAEAFSTALKIPRSFFDFLFAAAILGCFIPVYNSFFKSKDTPSAAETAEADRFACIFFNAMLLITGLVSVAGMFASAPLIALITPQMQPETAALASVLLKIMFPIVAFSAGVYTLTGVLQSKNSFILPAMLSTISNAGVILYFLCIDGALGENGVYGLAAAYLLSWLVQFLTLAVPLARSGFRFQAVLQLRDPALLRALKAAPPILLGSWLMPAASLLGTMFADKLTAVGGAIVIFDYADNLYIIIAGILTYSICNFLFPKLARLSAAGSGDEFCGTVRDGVSGSLMIVIPVMAAVFVLGGEGVAVLYRRGQFTAEDAELTAVLLSVIACGMPAFSIIELGSRVFYAKGLVRIPAAAALTGVIVNAASTAIFVETCADSVGIAALGIGNALGQTAAAVVLIGCAVKKIPGLIDRALVRRLLLAAGWSFAAWLAMTGVHALTGNFPYQASMPRNIVVAAAVFLVGAAVYIGGMLLSKKLETRRMSRKYE